MFEAEGYRIVMAKLVSKRGTKSVIWDFFGLKLGKDGKPVDDGSAICRSCRI